jgi:hypothetical protein
MYWLATVTQMQVVRREKRRHREQEGHASDKQQFETPTWKGASTQVVEENRR